MYKRHLQRVHLVVTALAVLALGLPSSLAAAAPAGRSGQTPAGASFVPGEVLVEFKDTADDAEEEDARTRVRGARKERLRDRNGPGKGRLELVSVPAGRAVADVVRELKGHRAVAFAEPNWIVTRQETSNDPLYTNGSLWGMYGDTTSPANQYGSQAGEAWAAGRIGSKSVYVGVIDEGIQFTHPDLAANVWNNPFDHANGVDDDGNGYVDDIHGWDFVGNNNSIYDGTGDDHGTHVTGTIAAAGGNAAGVAGVNWQVTYISAKFLGPNGGTIANAVKAVEYFTTLKTRHGLNIVATSNSWGCSGCYSQALFDAIERANTQNILFVAAAGNSGANADTSPHYPSSYTNPNVISVAAIASNGSLASFSNYGAKSVDLGAPGVGINSTVPVDGYAAYSGTSMATPHVSGAAALYASVNPGATAADIKSAILSSATPTASLTGKTVTGGRLDVCKMLGLTTCTPPPPAPPTAPGSLTASAASSSQIDLRWTDNATNEDGFKIERSTDGTTFTQIGTVGANVTTYSNTGLTASTPYHYRVRAWNAGGDSSYSDTVSATTLAGPPAAPAAPSNLTGAAVSRNQVNLAWTDNATSEDGFKIERSTNGTTFTQIATVGANVTTYSDTGLRRDRRYWYRVRAYNAGGSSAFSNTISVRTLR